MTIKSPKEPFVAVVYKKKNISGEYRLLTIFFLQFWTIIIH